ncbi:MAG: hypothetical protein JSW08_01265 [archaeon]|nr:MAG: hypothetical protein JSW08_01265 [archaeon]
MDAPVDKVIKLAQNGYTDAKIIKYLKHQGYTPKQINDAFNQAKVKLEMNKSNEAPEAQEVPQEQPPQEYQQQYTEQSPYQYPSYPVQMPRASADDVEEIVSEVIEEKWQEFKRKTGNIGELKDDVNSSLKSFEKRLTRIEKVVNRLSNAATNKFKEQGFEIKNLRAEMVALRTTIQKIMSPLMSKVKKETGMLKVEPRKKKTAAKKGKKKKTIDALF